MPACARSAGHRRGVGAGAEAQDLVVAQVDAVRDAGGVEHEDVAALLALGLGPGQLEPAHLHALALVRPCDGRVVDRVLVGRDSSRPPCGRRSSRAPGRPPGGSRGRATSPPRRGASARPPPARSGSGPTAPFRRAPSSETSGSSCRPRSRSSQAGRRSPRPGSPGPPPGAARARRRSSRSPAGPSPGWRLRARVNSRKSSGVRAKKHGSEERHHVGLRAVRQIELQVRARAPPWRSPECRGRRRRSRPWAVSVRCWVLHVAGGCQAGRRTE